MSVKLKRQNLTPTEEGFPKVLYVSALRAGACEDCDSEFCACTSESFTHFLEGTRVGRYVFEEVGTVVKEERPKRFRTDAGKFVPVVKGRRK